MASKLSAIRASTSIRNMQINQLRYNLSLLKAAYPTKSSTATAKTAKEAQSFFGTAAYGKAYTTTMGGKFKSTILPGTKLTYQDSVREWATAHGGDAGSAAGLANGYFNYGQGGAPTGDGNIVGYRPLDPHMQQSLQQAGQYTDVFFSQEGLPFLTQTQLVALTHGNNDFVRTVVNNGTKLTLTTEQAVQAKVMTPEQAAAHPSDQIAVWSIPAYGSNPAPPPTK